MSGTVRSARLPFDHLFAEVAAYPLASEAALTDPVTHLDPAMNPATARLWRAAERDLLTASPGVSLDDLVALRDGLWFGADIDRPRSLQAYLRWLSLVHLDYLGAGVGPRRPPAMDGPIAARPAHAQARQSWRWLTFALPEDLLLAMAGRDGRVPSPDLLTPAVRDLLRRGFAETHLHVGASLDFRDVWSLLMARLAHPGVRVGDLAAPGAQLREGLDLPAWLLRCAIARVALAGLLSSQADRGLFTYLHGPFRDRIVREAGVVTFSLALTAVTDLLSGRLAVDVPHALLQDAYGRLIGGTPGGQAASLSAAGDLDPVARLLRSGQGSAEQRLVIDCCGYLDARDAARRPDPSAAQLLWQVVRVRTLLYRHVTQRPLTPGLPWFIRFYGRLSQTRGPVSVPLLIEAAARRSGMREGLSSLEMRTSPPRDLAEAREWLQCTTSPSPASASALPRGVSGPPRPAPPAPTGSAEVGLVLHFVKQRQGEAAPGVPLVAGRRTTADPAANASGYRYATFFAAQRAAAVTLARILHRWPRALHLVRGLDICADELAVPAWVFRPLVMHIRDAAMSGARWLAERPEDQPLPLRTTVHAGEDFSHLLTGLRHIDEAMEVLDLREGDRIGHGLALGLDAAVWAGQVGRVAMSREQRVLDLAWEWNWWTRRGRGADAGRLSYLTREVPRLTKAWFGEALDPLHVEELCDDLADPERLRAVGFPDGLAPRASDVRAGRLLRYLTHAESFRNGRQTIWVDPAGEVDALNRIGASLRGEVARRGLAIEINPTSNLLIGDLGDLAGHPLWRLNSPVPSETGPRLAVTVGSDDPLVFNSSLPTEYQLLFDALVLAGLTDLEALNWLEGVRRTGLERRFTSRALVSDRLWDDLVHQAALLAPPL